LDVTAVTAGLLFGAAWWMWIDAHVHTMAYLKHNNKDDPTPSILFYYYLPGIFSTLGLIMANIVNLESLNSYTIFWDESIEAKVKVWLFVAFSISFGAIAAAIYIMVQIYLPPHNSGSQWPGIALTVQNLLLLISSFVLFWSRSERLKGDEYAEL